MSVTPSRVKSLASNPDKKPCKRFPWGWSTYPTFWNTFVRPLEKPSLGCNPVWSFQSLCVYRLTQETSQLNKLGDGVLNLICTTHRKCLSQFILCKSNSEQPNNTKSQHYKLWKVQDSVLGIIYFLFLSCAEFEKPPDGKALLNWSGFYINITHSSLQDMLVMSSGYFSLLWWLSNSVELENGLISV